MSRKKAVTEDNSAGKIALPNYKDSSIFLDPSNGNFEAHVGTMVITRTTLPILQKAIDRATSGTRAIIVSRRLRDVIITGQDEENNFLLSNGSKVAPSARVFPYSEELWKKLVAVENKQIVAEDVFNRAVEQANQEQESLLEGVVTLVKSFGSSVEVDDEKAKEIEAANGSNEDLDDSSDDDELEADDNGEGLE